MQSTMTTPSATPDRPSNCGSWMPPIVTPDSMLRMNSNPTESTITPVTAPVTVAMPPRISIASVLKIIWK
jgi:hypothetical protein